MKTIGEEEKVQTPSTDYCSVDVAYLGTDADRKFGKMLGIGETPEERAQHFAKHFKHQ